MKRSRLWLKIGIPLLVLLLLLFAATTRIWLDRLPDHTAETIAERYSRQLEVLGRLAEGMPGDPCGEIEHLEIIRAWQEEIDKHEHEFDDRTILGAEVVGACGHRSISYHVKVYEPARPWWTPSMLDPGETWPRVSLWYAGLRRVVQYEDRVTQFAQRETRVRLLFDLEDLDLE